MAKLSAGGIVLEFDATTNEKHDGSTTPTDHPVEVGSVVSDHKIDKPDVLILTCIVSNTPVRILASQVSRSVLGGPASARATDAYSLILDWRKSGTLVLAETELRTYEDMMIVSDSVDRDAATRNILAITIGLREFVTATVETTEAPTPVSNVDAPEPDLGRKQTADPSPEVEEKTSSLLADLANAIGGP